MSTEMCVTCKTTPFDHRSSGCRFFTAVVFGFLSAVVVVVVVVILCNLKYKTWKYRALLKIENENTPNAMYSNWMAFPFH